MKKMIRIFTGLLLLCVILVCSNVIYRNILDIKTQPISLKVKAGTTAKFSISASGHNKTYQWQYSTDHGKTWKNTTLTGYNTATLSVGATTGRSGYYYRCKVTDSAGNVVYSDSASLYVLGIKTQPTSQSVAAGTTTTFTVSATGHTKTYQWQYSTDSGVTWKDSGFTGNKTATLSVTAYTRLNGYQYRCKVTDSAGNATHSDTVDLYVLGIASHPANKAVSAGTDINFTVDAIGHDLTYQWQFRTSSSGSWTDTSATGNKTATLTVPCTARLNGYQYRCKITDSAGNVVYTNAATLTVK